MSGVTASHNEKKLTKKFQGHKFSQAVDPSENRFVVVNQQKVLTVADNPVLGDDDEESNNFFLDLYLRSSPEVQAFMAQFRHFERTEWGHFSEQLTENERFEFFATNTRFLVWSKPFLKVAKWYKEHKTST